MLTLESPCRLNEIILPSCFTYSPLPQPSSVSSVPPPKRCGWFDHDIHTPLHWSHSNHMEIFGTDVVGNAQTVFQFLHIFLAVTTIPAPCSSSLFTPPPPHWLDGIHHPPPDSSWYIWHSTPAPSYYSELYITPLTLSPHWRRNYISPIFPNSLPSTIGQWCRKVRTP